MGRILALILVLGAPLRAAAEEVGTVSAAAGTVEVRRAGAWRAVAQGEAVQLGDALRTGTDGRLQVLLRDDSVLTLAEKSQIVIDEQVYDPNAGTARTLLRMIGGRVRSLVSDVYSSPGSSYEVETGTAVAGVRGTEFIVVHESTLLITQVVAVSGRVAVNSTLERARGGVFVTAGQVTSVHSGELPTRPVPLDPSFRRQLLEGFDFIGTGASIGQGLAHPLAGGNVVPPADRCPKEVTVVDRHGMREERNSASTLVDQPPAVVEAVSGALNVRF